MLLRYVGVNKDNGNMYDLWMNMGSGEVRHVG